MAQGATTARQIAARPIIKAAGPVKPPTVAAQAVAAPAPEKTGEAAKSDTSRLGLEAAQPAKLAGEGAQAQEIKIAKPSEVTVAASKAKKKTGPVTLGAAEAKSDTSRIDLDAAVPVLPDADGGDAKTIRLQKPGAADSQHTDGGGPKTIRLKRPVTGKKPSFEKAGETVRIQLDEQAAEELSDGAGPKTIRIKRPASSRQEATGEEGRTVRIRRGGEAAAAAPTGGLSVKRATPVGALPDERSERLAQQEAELLGKTKGRRGRRRRGAAEDQQFDAGEAYERPEKYAWIWCLVSFAAMIVIGVLMWVFSVQLFATSQNLNWPGRILEWNDKFYQYEKEWM